VAALMRRLGTLLPSSFQEGKLPYMFFFVSLMIALLLVYAVISPYPYATPMFLSFAAFLVLLLLLVHGGLSLAWAVHLGSAAAAVLLLYAIWVAGGSFSPRMTWLMVLPLTPFYVLGRKAGSVWLCIALFLQALIAALTGLEIWPALALGSEHAFSSWVTATAATGVLVIVPLLYARMYQSALAQGMRDQAALELKKKELEHALLMREHFVATVSHELRTPLTAIKGALALLNSGKLGQVPEKLQKLMQVAGSNSDRLAQLINDLLDLQKFTTGTFSLQMGRTNLVALAQQSVSAMQPYAQRFAVELLLSNDVNEAWAAADATRIRQVMDNLISNAIKFSTANNKVVVRIIYSEAAVGFEVEDFGCGIPDEFKPRIFDKFSQADGSDSRAKEGTGLGLAICKKIIENHQGQIGFRSVVGAGSTFWFTLEHDDAR
jgi:signal transduction histidine kinase